MNKEHLTLDSVESYARCMVDVKDVDAAFAVRHGRTPEPPKILSQEDVAHIQIDNEYLNLRATDPERFEREKKEFLNKFNQELENLTQKPDIKEEDIKKLEDLQRNLTQLMSIGDVDPADLDPKKVNFLFSKLAEYSWEDHIKSVVRVRYGVSETDPNYDRYKKIVEKELRKGLSVEAKIEKWSREILEATGVEKPGRPDEREKELQRARYNFGRLGAQAAIVVANIDKGTLKIVHPENERILREVAGFSLEQINAMNLGQIKQWTEKLMNKEGVNLAQYFVEDEDYERTQREKYIPHSLEDLADLIIEEFETGDFGPGGKYEIIDAQGQVRLENLQSWFQTRTVQLHNENPDGDINPFSGIFIPTLYRNITFHEMVTVPRFRQKREVVISGTEGEKIFMEYKNVASEKYSKFMDNELMKVWMTTVAHNGDAQYRQKRGVEKDLFGVIAGIYANNVFLKDQGRLLRLLKLAASNREQLERVLEEGEQGDIGKAIQKGIMAYYYMAELAEAEPDQKNPDKGGIPWEENMFFKALGDDGTKYFFQSIIKTILEDKFSKQIKLLVKELPINFEDVIKQNPELTEVEYLLIEHPHKLAEILGQYYGITIDDLRQYNQDAKSVANLAFKVLKNIWHIDRGELNIFDHAKKEQRITDIVQKSISEGIGKSLGLNKNDREFAGLIPFLMRNWTGIAARNDTGAIGFDAWSKLINFGDYRIRQASGREGGGNRYSLYDFKRLSFTLFDGVNVLIDQANGQPPKKKTLLQVIRDTMDNNARIEDFRTKGNEMQQQAQAIQNQYNVMTFILDQQELNMSSFLKTDSRGYLVFDHKAAAEIMGGIWKYLRYAFDQQRFDMEHEIRDWYKEYYRDPKDGKMKSRLRFGSKKLKNYLFSDEVLNIGVVKDKFYMEDIKEGRVSRLIFADLIRREIEAHRQWGSSYGYWSIAEIEKMEDFFYQFSQEVEEDKRRGRSRTKVTRSFFTPDEWDAILEAANSPYWRMYAEQFIVQSAAGTLGGFLKAFLVFIKQIKPTL
jgi:hypothetical protein